MMLSCNSIQTKGFVEEDFVQYKVPSMFIGTAYCDWKCCNELGVPVTVCQNEPLAKSPILTIDAQVIYNRYISNPITHAVVIGGLEPMLQFEEVYSLIKLFRDNGCDDDFVIYTGYYPEEIEDKIVELKNFPNIIVKFGRYIPDSKNRYDEILGITLASDNQYGVKIS